MKLLLEIRDLKVEFHLFEGVLTAVDSVSLRSSLRRPSASLAKAALGNQ